MTTAGELAKLGNGKAEEFVAAIKQLIRDKFPTVVNNIKLTELVEIAYDEIFEATDLNYTEEPKGQNYCNAWWCFAEVASQSEFQTQNFFAEAEHVGYKRTTRHPAGVPQPNDLFAVDEAGQLIIDTENPKTILDALRKLHVF